jgi:hypothetical protein
MVLSKEKKVRLRNEIKDERNKKEAKREGARRRKAIARINTYIK